MDFREVLAISEVRVLTSLTRFPGYIALTLIENFNFSLVIVPKKFPESYGVSSPKCMVTWLIINLFFIDSE